MNGYFIIQMKGEQGHKKIIKRLLTGVLALRTM